MHGQEKKMGFLTDKTMVHDTITWLSYGIRVAGPLARSQLIATGSNEVFAGGWSESSSSAVDSGRCSPSPGANLSDKGPGT
jgi:hypothetical protein